MVARKAKQYEVAKCFLNTYVWEVVADRRKDVAKTVCLPSL